MTVNNNILTGAETTFQKAKELIQIDTQKSAQLLLIAKDLATEENNYSLLCEILTLYARGLRLQGQAYNCLEYLNKAYRLLNNRFPHDKIKLSRIYREFGSVYSNSFNDNTTALDYSLRGLSLNNPELSGIFHNNIGCQYLLLKQYDKAVEYLEKGKKICLENKEDITLCFIYENFGEMYRLQNRISEAIVSYEKGLKHIAGIPPNSVGLLNLQNIHCFTLIGLANTHMSSGQLNLVPDILNKIYDLTGDSKFPDCKAQAVFLEGTLLLRENKVDEFKILFPKAIAWCDKHVLLEDKQKWLNKMIELCEQQSNFKEAFLYSQQLLKTKAEKENKEQEINLTQVLENKELEILALENRNREMQLQKEQLEQFSYIVAHDLKTPLSNISNFIGLFSKKYRNEVDKENRYYLDFILENSKQLHQMLDELLKYISVGRVNNKIPLSNPQVIIEEITKRYNSEILAKNASIEFIDLPPVRIHPKHLSILMDNMIKNALKFSRDDRDSYIEIKIASLNNEYQFTIADNGIGIKEEYRRKIFDLFKQLDKVNYNGIGMGLAICKKIINTYNGKINVSTNDWGGTTFEFNIPKSNIQK